MRPPSLCSQRLITVEMVASIGDGLCQLVRSGENQAHGWLQANDRAGPPLSAHAGRLSPGRKEPPTPNLQNTTCHSKLRTLTPSLQELGLCSFSLGNYQALASPVPHWESLQLSFVLHLKWSQGLAISCRLLPWICAGPLHPASTLLLLKDLSNMHIQGYLYDKIPERLRMLSKISQQWPNTSPPVSRVAARSVPNSSLPPCCVDSHFQN